MKMSEQDTFAVTMESIRQWLKGRGIQAFEKINCGNSDGFFYKVWNEKTNSYIRMEIRIVDCLGLVFEAFPGIYAAEKSFYPAIARYCQDIESSFGCVYLDLGRSVIGFKATTFLYDNAAGNATMDAFEKEAITVLEKHYENLKKLACGQFLLLQGDEQKNAVETCHHEERIDMNELRKTLMDYFDDSDFDEVAENSNPEDKVRFIGRMKNDGNVYTVQFLADKAGFLIVRGYYGESPILIEDEFKYLVSMYFNEMNMNSEYSWIRLGKERESIYCEVATSLLDGNPGTSTLEEMELFLIAELDAVCQRTEFLRRGIVTEDGGDLDSFVFDVKRRVERIHSARNTMAEIRRRRIAEGFNPSPFGMPMLSELARRPLASWSSPEDDDDDEDDENDDLCSLLDVCTEDTELYEDMSEQGEEPDIKVENDDTEE